MAHEAILDISPVGTLGPTASIVIAGLGTAFVGLPLLFAVWRFVVYRRRTAAAIAASQQTPQKTLGPALLHGRVEADGEGPPVRITIDQGGLEESNKGHYSHKWVEYARATTARPFRLRLGDGDAVTVDPEGRVALVDTLETAAFEGNYRRRVAQLSDGEEVWVSGVLTEQGARTTAETAYRSQPGTRVLRGTRMEPVAVASGGFEAQFSYWQDYHRRAATALGIVFVLVQLVFYSSYAAALLGGRVESATITKLGTWVVNGKYGPVTHYEVHAKLPAAYDGETVTEEVSRAAYETLQQTKTPEVHFVVVPVFTGLSDIGEHAVLGQLRGVFSLFAGLIAVAIFAVARSSAKPWYEQKKVIERGSGHLAEHAFDKQVPGTRGLYEPG